MSHHPFDHDTLNPTQVIVKHILENADKFTWTLQGFGMLRTYLPNDVRLHVWDDRYAVKNVSVIHDHPWDFDSRVIVGSVLNWTYKLVKPNVGNHAELAAATPMIERTIRPGEGLQTISEKEVLLRRTANPSNEYLAGESYQQNAAMIHHSDPMRGTVTLVKRIRADRPDVAHVYYRHAAGFVSAEPRKATPEEVSIICDNSLDKYFN